MAGGAFAGRGVIVTGAGAGIGRGITQAYVREGARVVAVDVNADGVAETAATLAAGPGQVFAVTGDVSTSQGVDRIVAAAVRHLDRIDVLVNNAGVYPNCPVIEMTEEQWDGVLDTNLKGTFLMCRAIARRMVDQRIAGHIVNIASGAHKSARRGASHYCSSKAGIVMFTKVLAQELAEHKIHVNVVSPGLIAVGRRGDVNPTYRDTLIGNIPWGRMGQPIEIAEAVLFLTSAPAEYITGAVLEVDGGSSAGRFFLPYSRG